MLTAYFTCPQSTLDEIFGLLPNKERSYITDFGRAASGRARFVYTHPTANDTLNDWCNTRFNRILHEELSPEHKYICTIPFNETGLVLLRNGDTYRERFCLIDPYYGIPISVLATFNIQSKCFHIPSIRDAVVFATDYNTTMSEIDRTWG